jgi:protein-export membrane protein SecD
MIGGTPYLEFKTERTQTETDAILKQQQAGDEAAKKLDAYFQDTTLTGRFLKGAQMTFDNTTYQPYISLEFNDEGAKIFAELTKNNIGKRIAIYLDGAPISIPRVNEEIPNGKAQITGQFTQQEAKQLAERLNTGALPVPINLISQQNIGPSLGKISLDKSLTAGFWGLIAVAIFMILYYRKNGVLAVVALLVYIALNLAIFKLIPVTMSLAGIAGFILSIGMAVDANVLIFERMKEEKALGREMAGVIDEGFKRAWLSIRDGNITTLAVAVILYFFSVGSIRGFALTLFIGVSLSMFTAVTVTRILLKYVYRTS